MSFNKKLKNQCLIKNNRLCIGLDIDNQKLKKTSLDYMESFLKDIIDATIDICPVYKINFAFYEKHGSMGFRIIEKLCKHIDNKAITIADAKRGDIGNSSKYYAQAIFDHFNFDSITVAPYMGIDSIEPFVSFDKDKGVFILALTSNPGSNNFQKKIIKDKELFKHVIELCNDLNLNQNVGLVIGATNVDNLEEVNKISNNLPWLMPGIGFQGGDLKKSISIGEKNYLPLVNVSRGILYFNNGTINDIRFATEDYTEKIRNIL
tara:strand:- start:333 stop:1121 length:789 start_codon:yes stop_codon:yes gene_type:complete